MWASAESPALPWVYPYQDDGPRRLGSVVRRPIVPAALLGGEASNPVYALVDSGCHHILAAPWLAFAAGVKDVKATDRIIDLGIGGDTVKVRFHDLKVRLLAPDGRDEHFLEWEAEVGFVDRWRPSFPMLMGQTGFFDHFTLNLSLFSGCTAVEPVDAFDRRFGVPLATE